MQPIQWAEAVCNSSRAQEAKAKGHASSRGQEEGRERTTKTTRTTIDNNNENNDNDSIDNSKDNNDYDNDVCFTMFDWI